MGYRYIVEKKKWHVYQSLNGKQRYVGYFDTQLQAYIADQLWSEYFTALRTKACPSCGVQFIPKSGAKLCGSLTKKVGCSYTKMLEHHQKKYLDRRGEIRSIQRSYYLNNKELFAVKGENYRARKATSEGTYTVEEWNALKEAFDYRCAGCWRRVKLTADHKIPLTKLGTNTIDNIQPLCRSCNSAKRTKTLFPACRLGSTYRVLLVSPQPVGGHISL